MTANLEEKNNGTERSLSMTCSRQPCLRLTASTCLRKLLSICRCLQSECVLNEFLRRSTLTPCRQWNTKCLQRRAYMQSPTHSADHNFRAEEQNFIDTCKNFDMPHFEMQLPHFLKEDKGILRCATAWPAAGTFFICKQFWEDSEWGFFLSLRFYQVAGEDAAWDQGTSPVGACKHCQIMGSTGSGGAPFAEATKWDTTPRAPHPSVYHIAVAADHGSRPNYQLVKARKHQTNPTRQKREDNRAQKQRTIQPTKTRSQPQGRHPLNSNEKGQGLT